MRKDIFDTGKRKRTTILALTFIILGTMIVLLASPSLTGNSVKEDSAEESETEETLCPPIIEYGDEALEDCLIELRGIRDNEEPCVGAEDMRDKLIACRVNREEREKDFENFDEITERTISRLKDKIDELDDDIDIWKEDYETFAENTAKNICCKKKVDDPSINFYGIKNDMIVCSDEGGKKLFCD